MTEPRLDVLAATKLTWRLSVRHFPFILGSCALYVAISTAFLGFVPATSLDLAYYYADRLAWLGPQVVLLIYLGSVAGLIANPVSHGGAILRTAGMPLITLSLLVNALPIALFFGLEGTVNVWTQLFLLLLMTYGAARLMLLLPAILFEEARWNGVLVSLRQTHHSQWRSTAFLSIIHIPLIMIVISLDIFDLSDLTNLFPGPYYHLVLTFAANLLEALPSAIGTVAMLAMYLQLSSRIIAASQSELSEIFR